MGINGDLFSPINPPPDKKKNQYIRKKSGLIRKN